MKLKNRWYTKDGKPGLKNPKADRTFRRQLARLDAKLKKEEETRREKNLEKKNKSNNETNKEND